MAMTNGKAAAQSSAASVYEHLLSRGLSRRDFLRLCGAAAVLLELGRLPVPGEPGRSRRALRQAIARALHISAETLYVRAGILDPPPAAPATEQAILADPTIGPSHKQALVEVYRSFQREHAARARPGGRQEPSG